MIKSVYLMPNGMLVVFGISSEQLPEFQGECTSELLTKIINNCTGKTELFGF